MIRTLLATALTFVTLQSLASGEHAADEGGAKFGEGKAVIAFEKEEGFQLSDKAVKSLGITYEKIEGKGPWSVPAAALVKLKQSTGVYRKFEKWNSLVLVKVVNRSGNAVTIKSDDLEAGDEIAVTGAEFLRMTEADLNSSTVDNCAH